MSKTFGQIIYENYKGVVPSRFAGISLAERDEILREELLNMLGMEKYDSKAFRRAMRSHSDIVFNIIEDVIEQNIQDGEKEVDAFWLSFVEERNLALGDTNEFYIEGENALEVAEFSGSHFDIRRQRIDVGQKFGVSMRNFGIKVYEFVERVAAGRVTFNQFVALISEALLKEKVNLVVSTLTLALKGLPTPYLFTGAYDAEKILETVAHVEASTGQKARIVGTRVALRKLQDMQYIAYSDDMKNTLNNKGVLPIWQGVECVELPQVHKKGEDVFILPNDELYILTGNDKLVKLVTEGQVEVLDTSDAPENRDRTIEHTVIYKMGAEVVYNKMMGKIVLQ